MTEREIKTEKRLKRIWAHPTLCRNLIVVCKVCQYLTIAYSIVQVVLHIVFGDYLKMAAVVISAAVGFGLVTLMRKLIPSPRPYEVLDFCDVPPRKKRGESFPSRHAYSVVVIAILSVALTPWCAIGMVPVAVTVCLVRALVGIHFPRDIVVGALIGILFGVFGLVISYFL